jgi:hypothetical protein
MTCRFFFFKKKTLNACITMQMPYMKDGRLVTTGFILFGANATVCLVGRGFENDVSGQRGEDNHPPHAGFGRNPGPALRLDTNWLGEFFEVPFILHVSVMYYICYILSLFNLVVILDIVYYNFNTTKLVYMSKMAHEKIRTVKRREKGGR